MRRPVLADAGQRSLMRGRARPNERYTQVNDSAIVVPCQYGSHGKSAQFRDFFGRRRDRWRR